jgi:hypothetical protein
MAPLKMPVRKTKASRVSFIAFVALLTFGCKPSRQNVPATSIAQTSAEIDASQRASINFLLNPDTTRPTGYPEKILVRSAEDFVADKELLGQGCGAGVWEDIGCGMYLNDYGYQDSPWTGKPVSLSYNYAMTKTGTFLAGMTLGDNTYSRPDRNSDYLVWDRSYESERELSDAYRILMGGNSVDRKRLLTKLSQSLEGVEVHRFALQKRIVLESMLKNCLTDDDVEVISLANGISKTLRMVYGRAAAERH